MKEYSFEIDEALTRGLRPSFKAKSNNGLFLEFKNIEPSEYGVIPFQYPTVPWTAAQLSDLGIELDWPFPQLVRLKQFTFLLGADYIFSVDEDTLDLTQLTTYDFHSTSAEKVISTGGYWQFADFWDTFVLTNGSCSIWYDRFTDKLLVETSVRFLATEDYKGRAIFGGFNPDYNKSSAWAAYWTAVASSEFGTTPKNLNWNWIKWTSIGRGFDVLVKADMSQLDLLKNDFGEMPMEDRSAIVSLKKFKQRLVSYSLRESVLLSHKSSPLNTISPDDFEVSPGVVNVGGVAGDRNNHVWVSSDKELWWLGSNGPTNLGYQEFLQSMTGDIIVSHNPVTGSFYIASQDKTFNLTWNKAKNSPQGFSEVEQRITSCISAGSVAYSLGSAVDDVSTVWGLVTDEIDLSRTGDKTIGWIVFHGTEGRLDETPGTVQVRIHWKLDYRKDFGQSNWRTVNKYGACYFPIIADRFKVEVKGSDFREIKINRISGTYQLQDNRFTRGINANQINSASGN